MFIRQQLHHSQQVAVVIGNTTGHMLLLHLDLSEDKHHSTGSTSYSSLSKIVIVKQHSLDRLLLALPGFNQHFEVGTDMPIIARLAQDLLRFILPWDIIMQRMGLHQLVFSHKLQQDTTFHLHNSVHTMQHNQLDQCEDLGIGITVEIDLYYNKIKKIFIINFTILSSCWMTRRVIRIIVTLVPSSQLHSSIS